MLDSQDNGLSDGRDYDGSEDEAFPPLPPPHSPGQRGGQEDGGPFQDDAEEDGEVSKLADVPAAKRKGVKRPQPKLDSQRLISERGLPALRTLFDDVRFKGKGHEAEDLRLLMQKMENWAHRLYPRLQFEEFIDKVEKLGSEKEVQTCLKRIRLDMPLTHEDFMDKDGEEEPPPEVQVFGDPDPFTTASFVSGTQRLVHSTPAPATPAAPSLTEEQRRRMELNRQRALERRLARQQQQQADSQTVDTSSQGNKPTSVSSNDLDDSAIQEEKMEGLDLEPPAEAPAETPTEALAETPTEAPAETPTEALAETPTEAPAETPTEAPAETPTEALAETPTEAPTELPTEPPAEVPPEPPTKTSTEAPPEPPAEVPTEPPTKAPPEPPAEVPTEPPAEPPKDEES